MNRVRTEDGTAWAVGRADAMVAQGALPAAVATRIPPITWFSVASYIDSGFRGLVRVDAVDEKRPRVCGRPFVGSSALAASSDLIAARAQGGPRLPRYQGTGTSVSLSFDVPGEAFDQLGSTPSIGSSTVACPPPLT